MTSPPPPPRGRKPARRPSEATDQRRGRRRPAAGWARFHPRWLWADAQDWCRGRNPWWRLPLLLWGWFILARVLTQAQGFTPVDWLNFGIHELGHLLAIPFGQFIHVLAGSAAQIAVPLGSIIMFIRQRDYFGAAFCFCWLAESWLYLSHYIGDAQDQLLPLATPFGVEGIHDWHYLLDTLGLLQRTPAIAALAWGAALISVGIYLALATWLLWCMVRPGSTWTDAPDSNP
ncbi:MAG TPA: hypothetical protein PKD86_14280 [Gemmatales bacterium]|nr:hypothetical protein [Gemmatales bacterium]HMP60512.1 hypothetical protein [Gemmatales bacterium]